VLADIGGYTEFLSDVGIEHAKEITSHLMNGMVEVNLDRWKVGNVVGDCLFMYSDAAESPDEIFRYLRLVYESFRESIEEIAAGSTCRCGACDRSGDLALKFVVHAGEFDTQRIAGREELIGSAIVVAHRLLKNGVPVREYALVTTPLADVATASGLAAAPGREDYEDVGSVDYVYVDLQPVREAFAKSREVYLTEDDADVTVSVEIAAPPELVWRVAMDVDKATQWVPTLQELTAIQGEITEVGSIHTCLHGDGMRVVHLRVAVDDQSRRATDRLWNVPFVREMYQTWEVRAVATGALFSFHYALRPGVLDSLGPGDVASDNAGSDNFGLMYFLYSSSSRAPSNANIATTVWSGCSGPVACRSCRTAWPTARFASAAKSRNEKDTLQTGSVFS